MSQCNCNDLFGNLRQPGCNSTHGIAQKVWQVSIKDGDGNLNRIDLNAVPDATALTALFNEPDATKRYFPSPLFTDFNQTRAEDVTDEAEDGTIDFIREGIKSVEAFIWEQEGANPQMVGQMKKSRCVDGGVFLVDDCNNLIGRDIGDGFLYPIPYNRGSWSPKWVEPNQTANGKVQLNYNFNKLFKDEEIGFISYDSSIDLLSYEGLLDVVGSVVTPPAVTTTAAVIKAETIYGPANNKKGIDVFTVSDVKLLNETTGLPVVVSNFDLQSGSDRQYDLVYAAQTPADVLTLTFTKEGFDRDTVTINIP